MFGPNRLNRICLDIVTAALASLVCTQLANAAEEDPKVPANWYVQAGSYMHFSEKEDYVGKRWFLGIERQYGPDTVIGFSMFDNSFGQFSQYLYVGKNWHPLQKLPGFRLKLTGGVVHGYKGEHSDTSPINWGDAWAIGVIPAVGYQEGALGLDVALLGDSGLLFLVGYSF